MTTAIDLAMFEWQSHTPDTDPILRGARLEMDTQQRETMRLLTHAGLLIIQELRSGLEIQTTSLVGQVSFGNLKLTIRPKIPIPSLLTLFRYAHGLRYLRLMPETEHSLEEATFQELLLEQLVLEVSELVARGVFRKYEREQDVLVVPRGRIDIQRIARQGGIIEAALPCTFYPRSEDTLINRVILAGLRFSVQLTESTVLRGKLRRIIKMLDNDISPITLTDEVLERIAQVGNRLTTAYAPALRLVEILYYGQGVQFEEGTARIVLSGFLFDMNRFFEELLGRFLTEYLPAYQVETQHKLGGVMAYDAAYNPKRRIAPTPRPDYAIMHQGEVIAILDAKYRDIWEKSLSRDMLYQLALYALTHKKRLATILYPTVSAGAKEERIVIHDPLTQRHQGTVITRPVNLMDLAGLITAQPTFEVIRRRENVAEQLINASIL